MICHLHGIKDPKRGRLFTYRPIADAKLKMLRVTIAEFVKDAALKSELEVLYGRACALKADRNRLVHGLWGRMPKEHQTWKIFYHKDADDMIKLKRDVVTVDQVKRIAAQVWDLNFKLKKLMVRIGAPAF